METEQAQHERDKGVPPTEQVLLQSGVTPFFAQGGDGVVPRYKVVVADANPTQRRHLKDALAQMGCQVVAEATSVPDLLRKVRLTSPQLVVLDPALGGGRALEAARIVEEDGLASVVLVVADTRDPQVRDFHYVVRPFNEGAFSAAVDAVMLHRRKVEELRREVRRLRDTLESRKLVEKAKGILMRNLGVSEEQAYRSMQKQSMDKGIPLKDIAAAVILASEVGRPSGDEKGE